MISGKFIDLHVHTNYSDGFDSIKEVIRKAKENNVGVISLVEHYNVSSYSEACQLAGDDIVVIPGIELGADMSKYFAWVTSLVEFMPTHMINENNNIVINNAVNVDPVKFNTNTTTEETNSA